MIIIYLVQVPCPYGQTDSIPMPINTPMPTNRPMPIKQEFRNTLQYSSAPSNGYSSNGSTDNTGSGTYV
jgi:hypothetical protein